jgi:hypothetical protein
MSGPDRKVLLATLWQRTSERGTEYLSGFLGKARIVAFRGEPTADGIPTWDVYLTPGREQEAGALRQHRPRQQTTTPAATPPISPKEAPQRPFWDDPVDDIGRDR